MFITKLLFLHNSAKILLCVQLLILHMQRKEEYHNHENGTTYAAMITKFSAP